MKIGYYFFVFLASTGLLACSDNEGYNDLESDTVAVSVSLKGLSTSRATGPTNIFTKDTMNVQSVCINITDASNTVIVSRQINKSTELNSDWVQLTGSGDGLKFINVPKSVSKVYVYGNSGTDVVDNVISTDLKKQQGSNVIYYGVDEDLTPIKNEPIAPNPTSGQTYTAEVSIVPIVARMQIKSISFKDAGSFEFSREINNTSEMATVTWEGCSAVLKGIYFNNYYFKYNKPGTLDDLYQNTTFQSHITDGMWLFDRASTMDASDYASYVNYTDGVYNDLPLQEANKCYAFNFFPGITIPTIHLDLDQVKVTKMSSTNDAVFNPDLVKNVRFANIVKFYKDINTEMKPEDFKPGTIYNMDITVVPMLDNDLSNIQYNILIHVTIEPWVEETIIPDFDFVQ